MQWGSGGDQRSGQYNLNELNLRALKQKSAWLDNTCRSRGTINMNDYLKTFTVTAACTSMHVGWLERSTLSKLTITRCLPSLCHKSNHANKARDIVDLISKWQPLEGPCTSQYRTETNTVRPLLEMARHIKHPCQLLFNDMCSQMQLYIG